MSNGSEPVARKSASTAQNRWSLVALFTSAATFGLAFGGFAPLVALALERQGVDSMVIGANSAMSPIGTVATSFLVPVLIRRLGAFNAFMTGCGLTLVAMMLFPVLTSVPAWFVLRLLAGIGIAAPWVVAETWINVAARQHNRGRVMAIYATVMAAGFATGPLVLTMTGTEGATPFYWFAGVFFVSVLPMFTIRSQTPDMDIRGHGGPSRMLFTAPTIFAAAFLSGILDISVFSFLPLYGLGHGLEEAQAVTMLSLFLAGNLILQLPIGYVADKVRKRAVLLLCAAACVAAPALLPQVIGSPIATAAVLFVWGGCSWGLYSVGLAMLGERFETGGLAVANAAFMMAFEAGNIFGPPIAGFAFKFMDGGGFLVFLAGTAAVYFVIVAGRGLVRSVRRTGR